MKSLPCKAFAGILALSLTACATTSEPRVVTRDVLIPVRAPCTATPPAEPDFADTDDALRQAPNHVERVRLLVVGRLQRISHDAELHAFAQACAQ
jgi:hypothetical protein